MAMMQAGEPELKKIVGLISIDRQIERHRPLYYSVLQQTSGGKYRSNPADYNLEPLAWFFLKMLDHALAESRNAFRYQAL